MIKLSNVSVCFENRKIVYPDKEFGSNKITVITGPNGSGKTTLLKAISKLHFYDGMIDYEGFCTFTAQSPVMFNMSVLDNITYPLRIRNLNLEDYLDSIHHYCELLDLTSLLDENAKKLSSGEKMKVSIIRSIIFNPNVLLLDEPTTALDIKSIDALVTLLKEIKSVMTILVVSHDRFFIKELSEDTYLLGGTYV